MKSISDLISAEALDSSKIELNDAELGEAAALNLADKKHAYWLSKAQYYLAQRDHARSELKTKLQQFNQRLKQNPYNSAIQKNILGNEESDGQLLEVILDYCEKKNWLDDARYAKLFVESRHKKGIGKQKLQLELQQKGVAREIATQTLQNCQIDWFELAYQTAEKKFGEELANKDPQQKAKMQRFLLSRGFSFDEINTVFD